MVERLDRWTKEVMTHFLQALPPSEVNAFTNSNDEDLFINLSIVYFQISNTYLPEL